MKDEAISLRLVFSVGDVKPLETLSFEPETLNPVVPKCYPAV